MRAVAAEFGSAPHGLYYCDCKGDAEDQPVVTEINVGRFHMTAPHHDRVGKHNLLEHYLSLAFTPLRKLPRGVYDLDPDIYFLRGVDHPLKIVPRRRLDALKMA